MLSTLLLLCTYRSANIFLPLKGNVKQIKESILRIENTIANSTASVILRNDVCCNDADNIVFDALSGSRSGRINKHKIITVFDEWKNVNNEVSIHSFERSLLMSQITVFFLQSLYVCLQLTGFFLILRILLDTVPTV